MSQNNEGDVTPKRQVLRRCEGEASVITPTGKAKRRVI